MSIDVSKGNKYVLVGKLPAVIVSKGNKYVLLRFTPAAFRRRQIFVVNQ